MKTHFTTTLTILLFTFSLQAQITFENNYSFSYGNSILELPDHSFIGCGSDTTPAGVIYRLDKLGNLTTLLQPTIRGTHMAINDLCADPVSGGYAMVGNSPDTSGNNETGYYLLVDSLFQNTDSVFYSGGIDGPTGNTIVRTGQNNFVVSIYEWHGVGTSLSYAQRINYPKSISWSANIGSEVAESGFDLDPDGKLLAANFWTTSASSAGVNLFDTAGNFLHSYGISDTALGGSLIFYGTSAIGPNHTYVFSADISPSTSYGQPYVCLLDTSFNVIWDKYLDWGFDLGINAMTTTSDSCIVLLMNSQNGLALHKMRANGDSLWTQFHNRPLTGYGHRFRECSDRGFIITGSRYDSLSHAFVLKTDSLGRLLPPANITVTGQTTICPGDSVLLSAPTGNYSYQWTTNDTTQFIWAMAPIIYYVGVTDTNGLQAFDSIQINFYPVDTPLITVQGDTLFSSLSGNLQWYNGDTLLVGDTSAYFIPSYQGTYSVELTDSNGCVTNSGPFIFVSTSSIEKNIKYIETDQSITVFADKNIPKVDIYDINGRLIFTESPNLKSYTLEKNTFKAGIYFLSILIDDKLISKKFSIH